MNDEHDKLTSIYKSALKKDSYVVDSAIKPHLDCIAENSEKCKAVLAVTITLLLKKILIPEQDIRNHQASIENGFSARGLDTKIVTPFLRKNHFPFMSSGSGALTRSLEQNVPYGLKYTGKIKPEYVRKAFLQCIDMVQVQKICPKSALMHLFSSLIEYRDRNKNVKLIRPNNLSIKLMVSKINDHFQACERGSHLPVLAIYAVYKQLIKEVKRYKNCVLCELQSHTSPDSRSGFLGDVQVNNEDGIPFEVVEIKHGIELSLDLVKSCYDKLKSSRVTTYYLLSTKEKIQNPGEIGEMVINIYKNHGCQVIINGIQTTLRYYLRLLSNTNDFFDDYVQLLEEHCDYDAKMKWQEMWWNQEEANA